jgi:hypothetical protein
MRARGSASAIYNTLVHELFHAGYWQSALLPEGYWDTVLEARLYASTIGCPTRI